MPSNFGRAGASIIAVILWCALLLGAGCGGVQSPSKPEPAASPQGRPQRIVSLIPSATEILYGVGAFDRVVAVSDYCDYPPETARLPRVGSWHTNLERLVSFRPDLVVMAEDQVPFIKEKLDALKVPAVVVSGHALEDALKSIEQIGSAAGHEGEAKELAARTRARVEEVRARTRDLPRRRVLCVVDRVPGTLRDLYVATGDSFLSQLIEVAGGESIAPPGGSSWGKMQKEAIIALDPDIIIDLMMQQTEGQLAEDTRAVWRELPQARAVREGRVHALRDTSVLHPSQFVGDTARKFAELIHPEAFGK